MMECERRDGFDQRHGLADTIYRRFLKFAALSLCVVACFVALHVAQKTTNKKLKLLNTAQTPDLLCNEARSQASIKNSSHIPAVAAACHNSSWTGPQRPLLHGSNRSSVLANGKADPGDASGAVVSNTQPVE